MGSVTPYYRLTGVWKFWLHAPGTAEPDLDDSTLTGWTVFGATDGTQSYKHKGPLVSFSSNDYSGSLLHVRPTEGFEVNATLINMTLEQIAYALGMATSDVSTGTSGALAVKELPLRRGFVPTRYALLGRGGAVPASNTMSAYGAWPAQIYIPQGVFGGEPQMDFAKNGSPGLPFMYIAEIYTSATAGEEFGKIVMQSS